MTAAWPFLIARGRTRDYRTVLLPGVLTDPAAVAALADALPIGEPGGPPTTSTIGHGVLAGCRVRAQAALLRPADLGAVGDQAPFVTDEHGRPLVYLFGLLNPAGGGPDESQMATAGDAALRAYRAFLADEHGFSTAVSEPVEVPTLPGVPHHEKVVAAPPWSARIPVAAAPRLGGHRPVPQPPARRRLPRPVSLVAGAAVVALAAVVVAVAATRGGSPLSDLRVDADPGGEVPPCSAVPLTVGLTVDGGRQVTFRWRSGGAEIAEPQTRHLDDGPQTVALRPRLTLPAGGRVPLTLVVEPDDGDPATAKTTVQCNPQEDK